MKLSGFVPAIAAVALLCSQATASPAPAAQPTLAQLVGQRLLVRMRGQAPTASFLRRVRTGQVGGVVLFGDNVSRGGPARLIETLQAAARAGGRPPLLIAIDQEGGVVKRLAGPPTLRPSAMSAASVARAQGVATGRSLRRLGIALDLAPVLDVPVSPRAFIAPRAFSSDPAAVASRGVAFAQGLAAGGVAAAAKHFPGLGRLRRSTDLVPGRIDASHAALAADLAPFRAAVRAGVPAVMVGTAVYPAYGSRLPSACSAPIVDVLLRRTLGYRGVTISDDLATPGVESLLPVDAAAVDAVAAGIDMVYIGNTKASLEAYDALLAAAAHGNPGRSALRASYDRIQTLKRLYAARS